jgi:NADH-quinone oxidoreductase subunit K
VYGVRREDKKALSPLTPHSSHIVYKEENRKHMIPLSHYLILAAILFSISVAGIFINRKNVIILLMCVELMLLAVNMNFIAFSSYLGDTAGQVFVFFILTVAAAEAAIGLAILVVLFRNRRSINVEDIGELKG